MMPSVLPMKSVCFTFTYENFVLFVRLCVLSLMSESQLCCPGKSNAYLLKFYGHAKYYIGMMAALVITLLQSL